MPRRLHPGLCAPSDPRVKFARDFSPCIRVDVMQAFSRQFDLGSPGPFPPNAGETRGAAEFSKIAGGLESHPRPRPGTSQNGDLAFSLFNAHLVEEEFIEGLIEGHLACLDDL